jgi:hypothetical protein
MYDIETNLQFIELYKEKINKKYNDLIELKMIYNGKIQSYNDNFLSVGKSNSLPTLTADIPLILLIVCI